MNDRNSARDPEISGAQSTLLHKQILGRDARVGIIGMGYVGLPLALTTAEAGFSVTGFDLDADKVSDLNAGSSYIAHIAPENVASAIASERFHATAEFFELRKMDVILVCVPTPLTRQREPEIVADVQVLAALCQFFFLLSQVGARPFAQFLGNLFIKPLDNENILDRNESHFLDR